MQADIEQQRFYLENDDERFLSEEMSLDFSNVDNLYDFLNIIQSLGTQMLSDIDHQYTYEGKCNRSQRSLLAQDLLKVGRLKNTVLGIYPEIFAKKVIDHFENGGK